VRILHTSDWQLGITRSFLDPEAQGRYSGARLQAVRRVLQVAAERACDVVVVAGDVFEHPLVPTRVVQQAVEVLREAAVPVLLLPGNHDPLGPHSLYERDLAPDRRPPGLVVLDQVGVSTPVPGLQVVAAPYPSKQPPPDLLACALDGVTEPEPGVTRVLVAHGQVEQYGQVGDAEGEGADLSLPLLQQAVDRGLVHYVALGDHHSRRQVDPSRPIWFSGTPEVTRFTERDPGWALVVDVDPRTSAVTVDPVRVGTWRFERREVTLADEADVDRLLAELSEATGRDRAVLRLVLSGHVDVATRRTLDHRLDPEQPGSAVGAYAACQVDDDQLVTVLDDLDLAELGGYAAAAAAELAETAAGQGDTAVAARDALVALAQLVAEGRVR
jgi:DNA repair exonuclease SbcCD nuclease subunit